jgi:hypothetical protein
MSHNPSAKKLLFTPDEGELGEEEEGRLESGISL